MKFNRNLYRTAPDIKLTPKLTAKYVLEKTNGGLLIYEMILGPLEKATDDRFKNVLNPFYPDSKPSLSLRFDYDKERFTHWDYGDPSYRGDPFDFAAKYFDLDVKNDFPLLLERIMTKVREGGETLTKEFKIPEKKVDEKKKFSLMERKWDNLYPEAKEFLKAYKMDIETLKSNDYNTVFIDGFTSISSGKSYSVNRKSGQVMLAYKGWEFAKIYTDNPKKFRYVGEKPKDYIFGGANHWDECNVYGDVVIITGGEKDALVLNSLGYTAICLNSETSTNISRNIAYQLTRFNVVAVFYDNDGTGLTQGKLLADKYDYCQITFPEKYKGVEDVSDFVKRGYPIEELNTFIADQVNAFKERNLKTDSVLPVLLSKETNESTSNLPSANVFRTANQRLDDALKMPPIKSLFGSFWFTNELTILFGDTGVGKSLLAIGIADKISKGESLLGLKNETDAQKILFIDFELSDRQFLLRCISEEGSIHKFSENLLIDSINFDELFQQSSKIKLEEALFIKICELIEKYKVNVLIVDNITYLKTQTTQDGQVALEIMKTLNQIKRKYLISILALAHTPKRPKNKPLFITDLAGSKHLSNFADGVFGIEVSARDKNLRYLKQLKVRSSELNYGEDNVIVCEFSKADLLSFELHSFDAEANHLMTETDSEEELIEKAKELQRQGKTIRQIGKELGLSSSKVGRWLKK